MSRYYTPSYQLASVQPTSPTDVCPSIGRSGDRMWHACKYFIVRFLPFLRSPVLAFWRGSRWLEFMLPPWEVVGLMWDPGLDTALPRSETLGGGAGEELIGDHTWLSRRSCGKGLSLLERSFQNSKQLSGRVTLLQVFAWWNESIFKSFLFSEYELLKILFLSLVGNYVDLS